MPTIKTAISIDSLLFNKVDKFAHMTNLSRSQVFSQAVESLIEHTDNLVLLNKLNEVYGPTSTSEDSSQLKKMKQTASRMVKGSWK